METVKENSRTKRTAAVTVIAVLSNVVVIVLLILTLYNYSSMIAKNNQKAAEDKLLAENEEIGKQFSLYFTNQYRDLNDRKKYIENYLPGRSVEEAMQYLAESASDYTRIYQIIDCTNEYSVDYFGKAIRSFRGYTIGPADEILPIEYNDKYTMIADLVEMVGNHMISDDRMYMTATFNVPIDVLARPKSVALYTDILLTENGEDVVYALLSVIPLNNAWKEGIRAANYDNTAAAIINSDWDYIIEEGFSYANKNLYQYLYENNGKDFNPLIPVKREVAENGSGIFHLNSENGECVYVFYHIANIADWYYVSAVPITSLDIKGFDYSYISILLLFIFFLVASDGGIAVYLFRKVKRNLINISEAKDALEIASKAKSDFLSRMSHEIRTPLNAIVGCNSIIRNCVGDLRENNDSAHFTEIVLNYLNKSDDASDHLLSVINDVLDMSAIESGKMRVYKEPFALKELILSLNSMFFTLALKKGIHFQTICPNLDELYVLGDAVRINQILINLLNNAIKFTQEGGKVTFSTDIWEEPEQILATFTVEDSGIGMDGDFLKNIWQPFEQEGTLISRKYEGSGLGLSITKTLVDLMEGTIHVVSEKGAGSVFTVKIPFDRAGEEEIVKYIESQSKDSVQETNLQDIIREHKPFFAGKRILLVEDNDMNMDIATQLLTAIGIKVDSAWNGREAVEKFSEAEEGRYQMILMDVMMPEMDGLTAAKRIRALEREDAKQIPIIALTANAFSSDIQASFEAGMSGHISKPFEVKDFFSTLRRYLL